MLKDANGRPGRSNTQQAANDNYIKPNNYSDRIAAMQSRVTSRYIRRGTPGKMARLFAGIFCSEVCRHD